MITEKLCMLYVRFKTSVSVIGLPSMIDMSHVFCFKCERIGIKLLADLKHCIESKPGAEIFCAGPCNKFYKLKGR